MATAAKKAADLVEHVFKKYHPPRQTQTATKEPATVVIEARATSSELVPVPKVGVQIEITDAAWTLDELPVQIGNLHREIELSNEERYELMHDLLTHARKAVKESGGVWGEWIEQNKSVLGFGERQAQKYLREPETYGSDQVKRRERDRAAHLKKRGGKKGKPGRPKKVEVSAEIEPVETSRLPQMSAGTIFEDLFEGFFGSWDRKPTEGLDAPKRPESAAVAPVGAHITTAAGVASEGIDFAVARISIAVDVIETELGKGHPLTEEQTASLFDLGARLCKLVAR